MGDHSEDAKAGPCQGEDFPFKVGDYVIIQGAEYRILGTSFRYLLTNGNPDTLYAVLESKTHGDYIITHYRLKEEASAPVVERFIAPNKIICADPCVEGLWALGVALGHFDPRHTGLEWSKSHVVYQLTCSIMRTESANVARKVSDLYATYKARAGKAPSAEWLLFLAQLLNLVPKGSKGPGDAAVKRLLGIKE